MSKQNTHVNVRVKEKKGEPLTNRTIEWIEGSMFTVT